MAQYGVTLTVQMTVESPDPELALATALDVLRPGVVRTSMFGDTPIAEITDVREAN